MCVEHWHAWKTEILCSGSAFSYFFNSVSLKTLSRVPPPSFLFSLLPSLGFALGAAVHVAFPPPWHRGVFPRQPQSSRGGQSSISSPLPVRNKERRGCAPGAEGAFRSARLHFGNRPRLVGFAVCVADYLSPPLSFLPFSASPSHVTPPLLLTFTISKREKLKKEKSCASPNTIRDDRGPINSSYCTSFLIFTSAALVHRTRLHRCPTWTRPGCRTSAA